MRKIACIIVTFQPRPDALRSLVVRVRGEGAAVVIVDNGSGEPLQGEIAAIAASAGATFVGQQTNSGLAAGQNAGLAHAQAAGADYAVLFDQDSLPEPGTVARLVDAAERLARAGVAVGAVGPEYADPRSGAAAAPVRHGIARAAAPLPGVVEAGFLVSSGSCIPRAALERVGGMDESLFIEHIDTDWCFRARSLGLRLFVVEGARMAHEAGTGSRRVPLTGGRRVRLNAPSRYYYLFRNSVLLHGRAHAPAAWAWYDRLKLIGLFIYIAALCPPRAENVRMMLTGIAHGLTGRAGARA